MSSPSAFQCPMCKCNRYEPIPVVAVTPFNRRATLVGGKYACVTCGFVFYDPAQHGAHVAGSSEAAPPVPTVGHHEQVSKEPSFLPQVAARYREGQFSRRKRHRHEPQGLSVRSPSCPVRSEKPLDDLRGRRWTTHGGS